MATKDNGTPKWLRTIQLNSWEAELLVSALVLYALFQVPEYLETFHLLNFERGSQFHRFFSILQRAVEMLKYGYIFHILVRGLWVASVGLSYVFPKGINTDRLNFKGNFSKELNSKKSLVNNVLRLEELSSLFYGISFLAFGILLGVGTLLFSFTFIADSMGEAIVEKSDWAPFYFFVFFIYTILIILMLIDFLTNGLFRRIDWMAKWFYPVALVFRVITLSFLYRRSLLVLVSNVKGWKSYLIPLIVMTVCGGFILLRSKIRDERAEKYLNSAKTVNILNENYDNLRAKDDNTLVTIQGDIIAENALRLFVDDLDRFASFYLVDSLKSDTKWHNLNSDSTSFFLNRWLSVKVENAEFKDVRWFKTQHRSNLDFGFLTYLDIAELKRGGQSLSLSIDTTYLGPTAKRGLKESVYKQLDLANIYFFYDK